MSRLKNTSFIVMSLAALLTATFVSAAEPSANQIIQWLIKPENLGTIKIEKVNPIKLKSGEQAYLASAEFPDAARNFWAGYILARPNQKKAILLNGFGGQYNAVTYLKGDSHVIIGSAGSGQGNSSTSYSVVTFEGWNVKNLYSITENRSSYCEDDGKICEENEVFLNVATPPSSEKVHLSVTNIVYRYKSTNANDPKITSSVKLLTF